MRSAPYRRVSFLCSAPSVRCAMFFFFFNDTATTEIYTLSLHDALPISLPGRRGIGPTYSGSRAGAIRQSSPRDRKSTRLNSSHSQISYAVFCLKKKKKKIKNSRRNRHRIKNRRGTMGKVYALTTHYMIT